MLRIVLLIAAVAALVWLLRRAFDPKPDAGEKPGADPRKSAVDELVRCAHCGVHVPRNGAALRDGRHYCSEAHARLGAGADRS